MSRLSTIAVGDADGRDTRDVEEGEIRGEGRYRADFAGGMAELIHGTEIKQRGPGEKLTRPFLGNACQTGEIGI